MSYRQEKVSSQIKREISVLASKHLTEKYGIVTITDVEITADFKDAKVYVSVFDNKKENDVINELEAQAKDFQKILGRKLRMKFTPCLKFIIDRYQSKLDKVDKLFGKIENES